MKRFRKLFPEQIDELGWIDDGQCQNNFFYPNGVEEPEHLLWLHEMMCSERNVAAVAFEREAEKLDRNRPTAFSESTPWILEKDKEKLERYFQYFKLADSPETARLLIRQCEEEGEKQAKRALGKGR